MAIRPYTALDLADNHVPGDITEALGLPAHVHHARILVYAESREIAWRVMRTLGIQPDGAGKIVMATGDDVDFLATIGITHNRAVFALCADGTTGPIVKIVPGDGVDRKLLVMGELCRVHGRLHWHAAKNAIIISDDMVDAAYAALPGWVTRELTTDEVRVAVQAALDARG